MIPAGEDNNRNMQWKTTREVLREKHPQQRMPTTEILLHDTDSNQSQYDPIMFDRIMMPTNGVAFACPISLLQLISVTPWEQ